MKSPEMIEADILLTGFIRRNGKSYKPALLYPGLDRGPVGHCFDMCAIAALSSAKLSPLLGSPVARYVEGVARDPRDPEKWILHAWLTDGVHAYDLTWQAFNRDDIEIPVPTEYVGIEMDAIAVANFMQATEYQGVLANRFRDEELAKAAIYSVIKPGSLSTG